MTMPAEDEALLRLHDHLAERSRATAGFSSLDAHGRRAYMAEAKRRQREREKAARDAGNVAVTAAARDMALRDAALMILATGGPGLSEIRHALARAFPTKPGAMLSIEMEARSGKLRPKMIKV